MIPAISYFILKGKCHHCHAKISIREPFIEIVGGMLGIFLYLNQGVVLQNICIFYVAMILIAIAFIDLDTMLIHNSLNLALCPIALLLMLLVPEISFIMRVIGMCIISVPMLVINSLYPESFGGGDIKLCMVAGFMLGYQSMLVAAFIAIILAGSYAFVLLLSKQRGKKSHIAFGPFLAIGIFVGLVNGSALFETYLRFFIY